MGTLLWVPTHQALNFKTAINLISVEASGQLITLTDIYIPEQVFLLYGLLGTISDS